MLNQTKCAYKVMKRAFFDVHCALAPDIGVAQQEIARMAGGSGEGAAPMAVMKQMSQGHSTRPGGGNLRLRVAGCRWWRQKEASAAARRRHRLAGDSGDEILSGGHQARMRGMVGRSASKPYRRVALLR